jgi:hypothetical protein
MSIPPTVSMRARNGLKPFSRPPRTALYFGGIEPPGPVSYPKRMTVLGSSRNGSISVSFTLIRSGMLPGVMIGAVRRRVNSMLGAMTSPRFGGLLKMPWALMRLTAAVTSGRRSPLTSTGIGTWGAPT